jgi:hypothetical protein
MIEVARASAAMSRGHPAPLARLLTHAGTLPWTTRSWWLAAAATAAASTLVALSSGSSLIVAIALGLAGSAALAVLPFRWIVIALILASGLTRVVIPVSGVNLRPDIVLVPAALISCGLSGRLGEFFRWARHPAIVLLGLFVALQYGVSAVASPNPGKSFGVASWLLLNLLIVVLSLACFGDDRRALLRWLTITALIVVTSGYAGWVMASFFSISWGAGSDSSGLRAAGVAFEPNILAGTAAMWAVIILTSAQRLRGFQYAFLLLCLLTIPLSDTRAAAIAVAAGLAVYVVMRPQRVSRIALVGLVSMAAFAAVQATAPSQSASLSQKLLNYGDQTAAQRFSSWSLAVSDMNGASWLFGLGTNSYGQRHLEPTLLPAQVPAYLGNLPLQALYDSGLLGLGLLAASASMLIANGDRRRRSALIVTFLAISSATSPFFFSNWWLLVALALSRSARPVDPLQGGQASDPLSAQRTLEPRPVSLRAH